MSDVNLKKIAIIPARSGSKGLPNKNILMLLGKPLIAYTIEAAIDSKLFERIIVSTDSLEYKEIAEQYGAEVMMRSEELASDTATSFMVIEDILQKVSNFDYFMLLQPTSPFRNSQHIQKAVKIFEQSKFANFLVSVSESEKSSDLIKPIDDDLSLKYFDIDFSNYRRQNKKEYTPNGAIFIGRNKEFLDKKHFFGADSIAYFMDKIDSVDIDDKIDFELAICIQSQKNKKELLSNSIKNRIAEKSKNMNLMLPITLIGHSIFDHWAVASINGQKVNNLGIAGISSQEYLDLILEPDLISHLGQKVVLFAGTNDIVLDDWSPDLTLQAIENIVNKLLMIKSDVQIYLLSIPPVRGRIDRSNSVITQLNCYLKDNINYLSNVYWIELSSAFYDQFGNLPADFTYDGLHFTENAYQQLELELKGIL